MVRFELLGPKHPVIHTKINVLGGKVTEIGTQFTLAAILTTILYFEHEDALRSLYFCKKILVKMNLHS